MIHILVGPRISTTEATFQFHIIDSTIFQTNSFDVLSEFALVVSYTTCSAYSSAQSNESEKTFQQNFLKTREIVAMLGWLTPLYLVCVFVSLPNEIIKLIFNIFFFGSTNCNTNL